ncbi:MAG TPA: type II toxin-antitoxin system RatA family toxin [Caulobacteraceae bacterium]
MRHELTRKIAYTPDQVFSLVADVEAYPEFVPWIAALRTWNRREAGEGVTAFDAEAQVGFSFLKERFATRVTADAGQHHIRIELLYGPFKHLVSNWRFEPDGEGTLLCFDIDFAFKSRLLEGLLAANFTHAVDRLIRCFEDRARDLYGLERVP